MPDLVSVDEIRAAAARLDGVALRTPLVPFPMAEPRLLLKPESLQPVGSFKLRGAYVAISTLPAECPPPRRDRPFQREPCAGRRLCGPAARGPRDCRDPGERAAVKVAAARAFGAEVVRCEPGLAARVAATEELVASHGYTVIPPFDDRMVIAGQGTIGLEIAAHCPDVDLVLCPISGGGLISGIATAVRALQPAAKIIGVEPELAADARDSFRQRQRVAWPSATTQRTIADALRVEQIGKLPLQHMLSYVDDVVTVADDEIRAAMRSLAVQARLVAEPGGAVAVGRMPVPGRRPARRSGKGRRAVRRKR